MAFGIPNSGDLSALADKLGGIVASLGPEESAVVTGAISQLSDHATALETKTLTDLAAIVAPGIAQLTRACDLLERIEKGGMVVTVSFPS